MYYQQLKIILLSSIFLLGCNFNAPLNNNTLIFEQYENPKKLPIHIINCDTVYPNKKYEIQLLQIDTGDLDYETKNYVLKITDNNRSAIITDSIFSANGEVRFEDFNNDKVKDLLIVYDYDVRSNISYTLYLVDTIQNKLTKIKNFENDKNPKFNQEYDVIENIVTSGRDWTGFYKIQNDSIVDLGYIVYWGQNENSKDPNEEYKRILMLLKQDTMNK